MNTQLDLSQFYGTEAYHRTNMFVPQLVHTDGVHYFANEAGAWWFLDIVASEHYPLMKKEGFISIKLHVNDGKADIVAEDGDLNVLAKKHLAFTDCPSGDFNFFLVDNVLMLTQEY